MLRIFATSSSFQVADLLVETDAGFCENARGSCVADAVNVLQPDERAFPFLVNQLQAIRANWIPPYVKLLTLTLLVFGSADHTRTTPLRRMICSCADLFTDDRTFIFAFPNSEWLTQSRIRHVC